MVFMLVLASTEAGAQESPTKRDSRGPVTVVVTLMPQRPDEGEWLRVKVVLDTHSVSLDEHRFEEIIALRIPDGSEVTPTTVEQTSGGGHHREAVVVFAPVAGSTVRVVVKNVGGISERLFTWDLPGRR